MEVLADKIQISLFIMFIIKSEGMGHSLKHTGVSNTFISLSVVCSALLYQTHFSACLGNVVLLFGQLHLHEPA